ncbi:hypothetical protein KGM_211618 [Danaus plexippus plexippus]|uniref:Uncharacterized protein n=1 Tax=Danaus plexippus plexippus TaxID=278856 RepID=A0A212FD88_DANPL|nr:hypothetical protein KGM_211618 [Danaus plexippus plexippus]
MCARVVRVNVTSIAPLSPSDESPALALGSCPQGGRGAVTTRALAPEAVCCKAAGMIAALLFQSLPEDRGAHGIRDHEQHILHPRLRAVDDGAAPLQTLVRPPLLEGRRPYVSLAVGDGLAVVLDRRI